MAGEDTGLLAQTEALRSRLADLSEPPAAATDLEERDSERLEVARELAVLEILAQADRGGSVQQLLLEGQSKRLIPRAMPSSRTS